MRLRTSRVVVGLALVSTLGILITACSDGGSSPTEPEAPVRNIPTSGTTVGSDPGLSPEDANIDIEKSTNGDDADTPTGPMIPVGDPVEWVFLVTNTGAGNLINISVTDDDPAVTLVCEIPALLVPNDSFTCTAQGTATAGQYGNLGQVFAEAEDDQEQQFSDADPSHYFGVTEGEPDIDIEKWTNGEDADDPPGPSIAVGEPVDWEYVVTNTGDVDLLNVEVTDDQGVEVTCPQSTLVVNEEMTCTANGTAEEDQYENLGTVTAEDATGTQVSDDDPSHYFGFLPVDCDEAYPSEDLLWPPNHKFRPVTILGVVDGNNVMIDSIYQDEPVNGQGDGNTSPDGMGVGTDTAEIRAERAGGGDGRVYHIGFTAEGTQPGDSCSGTVMVGVPHDRNNPPVDGGPLYDSTVP